MEQKSNYTRLGLFVFILSFFSIQSFAQQKRIVDASVKIAYPDSGHYYISPGYDSVGYYIYNHGPDKINAGDRYWIRILLANVYLDPPTMGTFPRDIAAGDSFRLNTGFVLKYYNHRVGIDLCLTLRIWSLGADSMYREEDSAALFENNVHCILVAHNRVASVDELSFSGTAIYPNPVSDYFLINNINNQEIRQVSVSDNLGKIVASFQPSDRYTISELNKGMYYVTTYLKDGSTIMSKLIKE